MSAIFEMDLTGVRSLMVHLLGSPSVRRGDELVAQPRGHKVWGLLAFLVLTQSAQPRRLLAGMLFPAADDPLGALRWNISELRRLLGDEVSIGGDPIELKLPPGMLLDTSVLLNGTWSEAVRLPALGRDLLEGHSYGSAHGFELWLTNERARLSAAAEAILREATLASLARHRHEDAVAYAVRLVSLNPYDENAHVLLARALVESGDRTGAEGHVERTIQMFRDELGVSPSPSFRLASLSNKAPPIAAPSPSAVTAQLAAGKAAISAGAWLTGIEALRGAAISAQATDDDPLVAEAHLRLGSALVHSARGLDEEGAKALHQASALAEQVGHAATAAQARRELAYIELLRGRYERAFSWLDEASPLTSGNDAESSWIAAVRGACQSDVADYVVARSSLEDAIDRSESAEDDAAGAFAHVFMGRLHLLLMDLDSAYLHLNRSLELARSASWMAFVPFPMSFLAEVSLLSGEVETASETFDHAFALSCQLGDPCWESLGARGLGLVAAQKNDVASALARLDEAPRLCRRFPDSYLWVEAYGLEALCRVAVETDAPAAPEMIRELESIAARTGMRELLVRAMLHRAALGQSQALAVAESIIASIDNPALSVVFDTART